MKYALLIPALGFALSGCATAIPYSFQERCARTDMKLSGVGYSDSNSVGYAQFTKPNLTSAGSAMATVNSESTSISCQPPTTDEERQQIQALKRGLPPKDEYNNSIQGKRFLTGLGYFIYIVPGVIAKLAFDALYDKAMQQSYQLSREPASTPQTVQPMP